MIHIKREISEQLRSDVDKLVIYRRELAREKGLDPNFQTDEIQNETVGLLGEEVFELWLKEKGIDYVRKIVHGEGDHGDFIINGKIYEIKTGKMTNPYEDLTGGYRFFISKQQEDQPCDFYVNIQLDNDLKTAYIIGFIPREDTLKYPFWKSEKMYTAGRQIPLNDLKTMEEFQNEEM